MFHYFIIHTYNSKYSFYCFITFKVHIEQIIYIQFNRTYNCIRIHMDISLFLCSDRLLIVLKYSNGGTRNDVRGKNNHNHTKAAVSHQVSLSNPPLISSFTLPTLLINSHFCMKASSFYLQLLQVRMAVRAINNRSIFCSTSSPPISAFQSCSCYSRALQPRKLVKRGFVFHNFRTERNLILHGGIRSCSTHSLFDMVMEELAVMRKTKRIRATSKQVFLSLEIYLF